jgi:hypothetical protein
VAILEIIGDWRLMRSEEKRGGEKGKISLFLKVKRRRGSLERLGPVV